MTIDRSNLRFLGRTLAAGYIGEIKEWSGSFEIKSPWIFTLSSCIPSQSRGILSDLGSDALSNASQLLDLAKLARCSLDLALLIIDLPRQVSSNSENC
jgi:hypothetical protein